MRLPAARPWPAQQQQPKAPEQPIATSTPRQATVGAFGERPSPARARAEGRRNTSRSYSLSLALWLVVYTLLNVGDLLSTYLGLQAGLREANPLMSNLLAQDGFGALIAYKLIVIVAVVAGALTLFRMHPRAAYFTVHICNGLVFLAVFLNVAQMLLR
jgi:hypothetical protein